MHVSRRILVLAVALCTVVAFGSIALAGDQPPNLVLNGGFERPTVNTTSDFEAFTAGDTLDDADEWTVDSGTVDLVEEETWDAFRGQQAIDLNGDSPGSISQEIDTEAGDDYLLRFQLAGNPGCTETNKVKVLDVHWDGELVATFYYDTTGQTTGNIDWQRRVLELSGDQEDTELRFSSDNSGNCGPMLDGVSLRVTG
jgi:choice-of-anchor C domain-containing protein